jgi:hypothetical protein
MPGGAIKFGDNYKSYIEKRGALPTVTSRLYEGVCLYAKKFNLKV